MKLSSLILALAVLPAAAFAAAIVIPGGNHSTPYVMTKPGSYVLDANRVMTNASKNAIEINASDVTLNLNGYAIRFSSTSGTGYGISIPTAMNVEIRNGSLINTPGAAVYSDSTVGVGLRLIDLRVSDTHGIYSAAAGTLLERCQITDTEGTAFRADEPGAVVRNCTIHNATGGGITVSGGSQVVGNTVGSIGASGIIFQIIGVGDTGGLIADNMVNQANSAAMQWGAGIKVSALGVVVRGNNVHDCRGAGIRAEGTGHVIDANNASYTKASSGTGVGNAIYSASNTTIVRNNIGVGNAGDLLNGFYTNAGGNVGN